MRGFYTQILPMIIRLAGSEPPAGGRVSLGYVLGAPAPVIGRPGQGLGQEVRTDLAAETMASDGSRGINQWAVHPLHHRTFEVGSLVVRIVDKSLQFVRITAITLPPKTLPPKSRRLGEHTYWVKGNVVRVNKRHKKTFEVIHDCSFPNDRVPRRDLGHGSRRHGDW
jgi:hypothetical protein